MNLGRQMLEAVGDLEPTGDDPDGEFAQGAFAILTAALGKLPEARREALLAKIEDGDLRRAVEDYMARYGRFTSDAPAPIAVSESRKWTGALIRQYPVTSGLCRPQALTATQRLHPNA